MNDQINIVRRCIGKCALSHTGKNLDSPQASTNSPGWIDATAPGQARGMRGRHSDMSVRFSQALAWALVVAAGTAVAREAQEPVAVRVVRAEKIFGGVERPTGDTAGYLLQAMPDKSYEVKNGIYRSVLSRIALRVPRIGEEKLVDVREAIAMVRADGSAATTHIMFDPGGTRVANGPTDAQSAVIVTRLRDDRPKDAEQVLARLNGGEAQRAAMASRGIAYARVETKWGPALQRVVRNRAHTVRFPYDLGLLKDSGTTTYGVTAYVVVGTDSLVEFSQLFPCGDRSDADCRAAALKVHDAFVDGVTDFLMYATQGGAPASSAH